jgi:hypothetical protein
MRWQLRNFLRRTITYSWARRIAVAVIGGSVVLVGVAMIVLPGPAIVVIPLGLGILGLEFAWARHWLRKLKVTAHDVVNRVRGKPKDPDPPTPGGNPAASKRESRRADMARVLRRRDSPRSLKPATGFARSGVPQRLARAP